MVHHREAWPGADVMVRPRLGVGLLVKGTAASPGSADGKISDPVDSRAQHLRAHGLIQPLLGGVSWRAICRYRSMMASDYFMHSREIPLRDSRGTLAAQLCSTVYGVSADLHASLQALFFSIAIEPMVQVCNRLCCGLKLEPMCHELAPGDDFDLLQPAEALWLDIDAPCGPLQMIQPIHATSLRKEGQQRQLVFHSLPQGRSTRSTSPASLDGVAGRGLDCGVAGRSPAMLVTMATEPG
eukprot:CAMPEP_0203915272 /NCGR_PEP_ID=MMETSP0359-20131031/56087_1 /ASSEMBLY_ACC=CAM_ASM_000338 /TAXON_ID=268821 /ORGANISM="Scrippsiella Hangoei, Strain SHTV-5" /LENGTH=239 /DNA_ID=CAMNT_0050841745 /DNA_START=1 /DNA_END=717 /DNA_ORIENTATION=-